MLEVTNFTSALTRFGTAFFLMAARYLLFSGFAFLVFYYYKPNGFKNRRIQKRPLKRSQIKHEIRWSLLSILAFACLAVVTGLLHANNMTNLYYSIDQYGWVYFFLTFIILLIIHDSYFYFIHRFMHHPKVYHQIHAIHHRSTNPSPWAAFSFHPLEALLEMAFLPLVIIFLPVHPAILLIFFTASNAANVLGHLGYEILPQGFTRGVFSFINTATHHNMHHQYQKYNFGFYFNIWDRILSTNHPRYHETFERVTKTENKAKHNLCIVERI